MKSILLTFALSGIFLLLMTECERSQPEPVVLSVDSEFVKSTNDFAFDFLQKLDKEEQSENFFVSPLSLHMALGMLLNGADNESKDQLLKTLKLEGIPLAKINENYLELINNLPKVDPKVKNLLANSIWQRAGFPVEETFKSTLKSNFKAEIHEEPFDQSTLNKINQWASDNTNHKIEKVLEEISSDMVMYLMNALYFKGDWAMQFDKDLTSKTTFFGSEENVEVDMMRNEESFSYAKVDGAKALEMEYGNGQYRMRVILPDNGNVKELISGLDENKWQAIGNALYKQKVDVRFPKLKMTYKKKLNEVLEEMGMPILFTTSADLSKISPPAGKINVSFVQQDAFVEVDEKGTEAAAVTTIGIELTSAGPEKTSFVCNKPFLFFIYEKSSGTIRFTGKIENL